MAKLKKRYDPSIEKEIINFWKDNNVFKFNPNTNKKVFSIDSPPPTISGDGLHMGHVLNGMHFEFAARYRRMKGYEVFFPEGFDDNGLPTERFIEKKFGVKATQMPRKEFIDLCRNEIKKVCQTYKDTFVSLGFSIDWSLSYDTISPFSTKIAQKSFIDLFKKGRIERSEEVTIWCPFCQTALAQDDMEDREEKSTLNTILFELENGEKIKIATTRPELLPACVGVFVNPSDERYKNLIGKKAKVPLFEYDVPIMADDKVDKEFGTGLVMVCTFGDQTDVEWWRKYSLPLKIILNKDGTLNEKAEKYKGLSIKEARAKILEDLKLQGLLVEQEEIVHAVNVHERCKTPIEFLVSPQWKIKQLDLKDKMIEQGQKIKWFPEFMEARFDTWIKGLKWDWIISRQRPFGIPFPIWYCKKCGTPVIADEKDLPVYPSEQSPNKSCPKCGSTEFLPEKDVMDTWMTSSLTPLITARWGEKDSLIDRVYPFSLRPQAHEIIRTWTYYTILKSYLHTNSIPWKEIAISGWCLDRKGKKMSKSAGNGVEPLEIIKKYPVDALRWWAATANIGEDFRYKEQDLQDGSKFLNKIWNAARFVGLFYDPGVFEENNAQIAKKNLSFVDKWIIEKLRKTTEEVDKAFENYAYGNAKKSLYLFFKTYFCDNYLEFIKWRLYSNKNPESKLAAQYTVALILKNSLKLFHPFIPFITEKIWLDLFEEKQSIAISLWSDLSEFDQDKESEKRGDFIFKVVGDIRTWKANNNKSVAYENFSITLKIPRSQGLSEAALEEVKQEIKNIARAKEITTTLDENYSLVCKDLAQ